MHPQLPSDYVHRFNDLATHVRELKPTLDTTILAAIEKPFVFIAGPYTRPYPIYNTHRAMAWYDTLADSGVVVPYCSHWTLFQDLMFPRPYEDWLALDGHVVRRSDGLIRLIGESGGADGEVKLAQTLGIPMFSEERFEEFWLFSHFRQTS